MAPASIGMLTVCPRPAPRPDVIGRARARIAADIGASRRTARTRSPSKMCCVPLPWWTSIVDDGDAWHAPARGRGGGDRDVVVEAEAHRLPGLRRDDLAGAQGRAPSLRLTSTPSRAAAARPAASAERSGVSGDVNVSSSIITARPRGGLDRARHGRACARPAARPLGGSWLEPDRRALPRRGHAVALGPSGRSGTPARYVLRKARCRDERGVPRRSVGFGSEKSSDSSIVNHRSGIDHCRRAQAPVGARLRAPAAAARARLRRDLECRVVRVGRHPERLVHDNGHPAERLVGPARRPSLAPPVRRAPPGETGRMGLPVAFRQPDGAWLHHARRTARAVDRDADGVPLLHAPLRAGAPLAPHSATSIRARS